MNAISPPAPLSTMPSQYEDYMTAPIALRLCYGPGCGSPESEELKLKKCARCASVVYCSKECQKKHWTAHKPVCRTIDEAQSPLYIAQNRYAKAFGFHNADEFVAALRDFVAAHTWAFQSYAKALLALTGGPDYMNTPPKQLWVRLKCLCTQGSSRDPARTFAFLGAHWQTVEEYLRTATGKLNWQKSAAMRTEVQRRNSDAPRYAGELPMLFAVENIDLWHGALYSQYYPDPRGATVLQGPDGLSTEIRRVICGDVLTLCASSIHLGLALRCAEGQPSIAALPGRFVRTELKRWKWEPLFMDWDQYLAGPRGI